MVERLKDEAPRFAQIFPALPRLVHRVLERHAHPVADQNQLLAALVLEQRRTNRLLAFVACVTGVAVASLVAMHFIGA
jgi:ubiquinone biosynthesis protein